VGRLIYSAICSLDGYVEDASGRFDWAAPDEELHAFVNELERNHGTYLYGRRMYDTMVYWERPPDEIGQSPASTDFAKIWQAAEKIVFSGSLTTVSSARTRIEPVFDPAAVRSLMEAATSDLSIGGATLAASAFAADLIDECHLILHPVVVGAGKAALPTAHRLDLELIDHRRFDSGVVFLHYRVLTASDGVPTT
jgi:dihydrofolate reductase